MKLTQRQKLFIEGRLAEMVMETLAFQNTDHSVDDLSRKMMQQVGTKTRQIASFFEEDQEDPEVTSNPNTCANSPNKEPSQEIKDRMIYNNGFDEGYKEGVGVGTKEAELRKGDHEQCTKSLNDAFKQGFEEGKRSILSIAQNPADSLMERDDRNFQKGFDQGYEQGQKNSYEKTKADIDAAYLEGEKVGYKTGYEKGMRETRARIEGEKDNCSDIVHDELRKSNHDERKEHNRAMESLRSEMNQVTRKFLNLEGNMMELTSFNVFKLQVEKALEVAAKKYSELKENMIEVNVNVAQMKDQIERKASRKNVFKKYTELNDRVEKLERIRGATHIINKAFNKKSK